MHPVHPLCVRALVERIIAAVETCTTVKHKAKLALLVKARRGPSASCAEFAAELRCEARRPVLVAPGATRARRARDLTVRLQLARLNQMHRCLEVLDRVLRHSLAR